MVYHAVLCMDHANRIFQMNRYLETHSRDKVTVNSHHCTVVINNDTYHFLRPEDKNTLYSYVFDSMIIPAGYSTNDREFEIAVLSRVRLHHENN